MKSLIVPLLVAATLPLQGGEDEILYLTGAVNGAETKTVLRTTLDAESGKLTEITTASDVADPSFFTISKDGKFLYAGNFGGKITSLAIQPDGSLKTLNEQPDAGKGICHVELGGGQLFTANYISSDMAVYPVKADGTLAERSALIPFTGSGPHPKRQQEAHPHSTYVSNDGKFVYLCDLGTDSIWSFALDSAGNLTPTDPPSGRTPPGAGPRHLAWGANQEIVYVANEMGLSVTTFRRDPASGVLTPVQTISTLPDGATVPEKSGVAEIISHPNGKYVYVSTRGPDTLTVFSVGTDGQLTLVENVPAGVKTPRSFDLSPSGKCLVVAGQGDNRVAVLKIDPATGKLTPASVVDGVLAPVCVRFLR